MRVPKSHRTEQLENQVYSPSLRWPWCQEPICWSQHCCGAASGHWGPRVLGGTQAGVLSSTASSGSSTCIWARCVSGAQVYFWGLGFAFGAWFYICACFTSEAQVFRLPSWFTTGTQVFRLRLLYVRGLGINVCAPGLRERPRFYTCAWFYVRGSGLRLRPGFCGCRQKRVSNAVVGSWSAPVVPQDYCICTFKAPPEGLASTQPEPRC